MVLEGPSRWATAGLLLLSPLIASLAGCAKGAGELQREELTYTVTRGPLVISFTEKGAIKALRSVNIYSQVEGLSTIVNVVPEGTFAKRGDVLVELDSSELTQLLNQQTIAVDTAQAALIFANEAVEIQKSLNETDLKAAELLLQFANVDLEKYQKGDWPLAQSKAESEILIAGEELKRAETKLMWTRKLSEKGYVTQTELIADEIALKKAQVQNRQAIESKAVLEKYTHSKDFAKAKSDVEQANRALERARLKAQSVLKQAEADQTGKKSTYNLSVRRLQKIKDQVEKTKIVAPNDGMVVYHQDGRYGRDDRVIEQGATVRENQHLMDLPDLSVMAVTAQIPEARIHQVHTGLRVMVTIDAQTERFLSGIVTKIGLLPDYVNRWMNPDLKVYQTEITIDPDQDLSLLRPGMSAKVEILVDQISSTLFVPIQSVTTIDAATVCFVLEGGEFRTRRVEIGPTNDSFVVIRSGLKEGDVVKLTAPRPQANVPDRDEEEKKMEKRAIENDKKSRQPESDGPGGDDPSPVPAAYRNRAEDGPNGGRRTSGSSPQGREDERGPKGNDPKIKPSGTEGTAPGTAPTARSVPARPHAETS